MDKSFNVKEQDLRNFELKGNFLYEENGEYFFSEKLGNAFFEIDKKGKNYEENPATFDGYVHKFMNVCSQVNNKPSLLFVNYLPKEMVKALNNAQDDKKNYEMVDIENPSNLQQALNDFNNKPCVSYLGSPIYRLVEIFESRSKSTPKNDLYIFFNEPEYYKVMAGMPSLSALATTAKVRNIYFVFNIVDKDKFISLYSPEEYETLKANCQTTFI